MRVEGDVFLGAAADVRVIDGIEDIDVYLFEGC